jgi:hypothetical protein
MVGQAVGCQIFPFPHRRECRHRSRRRFCCCRERGSGRQCCRSSTYKWCWQCATRTEREQTNSQQETSFHSCVPFFACAMIARSICTL